MTDWQLRLDNKNELRDDRGVYRLVVAQLRYAEGEMVPDEVRPGCITYGQWRHFRITTTSARDASITVVVNAASGRGLAGLYVRQYARPSEKLFTAMAERGAPASTPQRVTVSPCNVNVSTTWHIAVMLEEQAIAISRGVTPTAFSLSVHLESAILDQSAGVVVPRGGDSASMPAKGLAGDGFACCGAFKYFLVPRLPAHLSLMAELVTTAGEVRAIFLKAKTCPEFPADVRGERCTGKCKVAWLTTYDRFDGTPQSVAAATPMVPNGLDGLGDLRAAGDWYIGVQALPGTDAEFSLRVSAVEPPPRDRGHQCDPSEPECRGPQLGGGGHDSAAPRRGGTTWRTSTGASIALVAAMALGLALQPPLRR